MAAATLDGRVGVHLFSRQVLYRCHVAHIEAATCCHIHHCVPARHPTEVENRLTASILLALQVAGLSHVVQFKAILKILLEEQVFFPRSLAAEIHCFAVVVRLVALAAGGLMR